MRATPFMPLLGLLALACGFAVAGCCSSAVLDKARARAAGIRAALVRDLNPDVPDASACADVPLVTLADVARGVREGELVAIEGVPREGWDRKCTQKLCRDECGHSLTCCNECSSGLRLSTERADPAQVELAGAGLGCTGYDCGVQCRPFGNAPERAYRFVGRYHRRASSGTPRAMFVAKRWCHVPGGERSP